MFPESVFAERRAFIKEMSDASKDYLAGNAVALTRILSELQNSLALELQVIHGVRQLHVDRPEEVDAYVEQFRDYVESRTFSLERTNCHRIGDIYRAQIENRERGYTSADRIDALRDDLSRLAGADAEFTEEIEPFMDRCLALVVAIRDASKAGDYPGAQRLQDGFRDEYRPEVERLKAAIHDLNNAGMSLLDMLGE
jgi:hypothetical protein